MRIERAVISVGDVCEPLRFYTQTLKECNWHLRWPLIRRRGWVLAVSLSHSYWLTRLSSGVADDSGSETLIRLRQEPSRPIPYQNFQPRRLQLRTVPGPRHSSLPQRRISHDVSCAVPELYDFGLSFRRRMRLLRGVTSTDPSRLAFIFAGTGWDVGVSIVVTVRPIPYRNFLTRGVSYASL